jgi:hypothetical protein
MEILRQRIVFMTDNKEIEPILSYISKTIYLGSV